MTNAGSACLSLHLLSERNLIKETLRSLSRMPSPDCASLIEYQDVKLVGGLDISTTVGDPWNAVACLTIVRVSDLQLIDCIYEQVELDKPYIPGFLAFREAPSMIALVNRLKREKKELMPQVLFVDGNGILHPDRFGLACHVGAAVDIPTVGVAKDLHLVSGIVRPAKDRFAKDRSAIEPLVSEDGTVLGAAIRTGANARNPVFISIGYGIDLNTALDLTRTCSKYRVPEPIRLADILSRKKVQELF